MLKQLEFDWLSLRVALEGQSFLDVPRLNLKSKAEAKQFLLSYGYDVDDPTQKEEIWRIYFQSVAFLRDHLLDPGESFPSEFLSRNQSTDILRLLTDASAASMPNADGMDRAQLLRGRWACAVLRVMHIISHLDNDVRLEHFQYARQQVFERFEKWVSPAGPRRWKFGQGPEAISLVRFLRKERKERNSILIKLLSKPQTVVEEIYDRLGFRFVTETRFDCYRLVQTMFDLGVVSPPNVQPGRSVNTLIPFDVLSQVVSTTASELQRGEISVRLARRRVQKLEEENLVPLGMMRNPFSSRWYRAIQFTCRQLITAPDPTYKFWKQVEGFIKASKQASPILKKIPITLRETKTFYYPFEIQIMDIESYVESIGGRSRHREYKGKQRLMARNRVLRDLI
jgi:uncharacterized protein (TIGR04562 family)